MSAAETDLILGRIQWGRKCKKAMEVLVAQDDLDRIAAEAASAPEATLQLTDWTSFAVALPDYLRRQFQALGDDDEIPEIALGADGILGMKKNPVWWTEVVDGVAMKILKGKMKGKVGGQDVMRDRYRIPLGSLNPDKTYENVFDDPERAKERMREIGRSIAKQTVVLRSDEGKSAFDLFKWHMQEATNLGIKNFGDYLAQSLTATKMLWKHRDYDPFANAQGMEEPQVVKVVTDMIDAERRRAAKKPGLVSVLGPEFVEHHRRLHHAGGSDAVLRRNRAHINDFVRVFGKRELHTIDHDILEVWVDEGGKCKQERRSSVRAFFTWARDERHALPKTETEADRILTRKKATPRVKGRKKIEFYSASDASRIMHAIWVRPALHPWIPVLVLRFFGGIHLSEIMSLDWSKISDDGVVDVGEDASGQNHYPRPVFLSPAAQTWLQDFLNAVKRDGLQKTPIVPGMDPNRIPAIQVNSRQKAFSIVTEELLADAKIKPIRNGMRRAFATHLFRYTYSIAHTRDQMGSHDIDLFRHYIELEMTDEEAVRYFNISRPDIPAPETNDDWLPEDVVRKTRKAALHDINAAYTAARALKKGKKLRR